VPQTNLPGLESNTLSVEINYANYKNKSLNKKWKLNMEIIIGIIILVLIILYFLYARIIRNKNNVLEALAGIDVQLKNRSNLIPNILTIAKKFMTHEKDLLENVTKLRTRESQGYNQTDPSSIKEHISTATALGSELGKMMISVEAYPDLKSDETMVKAQLTYNEVESKIAAARRFYNSAVAQLNNSIEIFPGSILAKYANAQTMPFYEADEASKESVSADNYL